MPYALNTKHPPMTILVNDDFDSAAVTRIFKRPKKMVVIRGAAGRRYVTLGENISLIQEIPQAEMDRRMAEAQAVIDKRKAEEDEMAARERRRAEKLLVRAPRMVIAAPGPGKLG